MKSPIFLFSLPRSGSTLLQRILMSHPQIASIAEPWLMLPFVYAFRPTGVLTEYSHGTSYIAIEDFIDNLPNQDNDYFDALRQFVNTLYTKQCRNDELYFLDKTPRYYLIIPEILKTFPDAKFIFLCRNPVHVMSSIMRTWNNNSFKHLYNNEIDLKRGFDAISEGCRLLGGRAHVVQYEQLVSAPAYCIKEICSYLEIEFDEAMLESFINQDTKGRMGDSTGVKDYQSISESSLDKWKGTFNTAFRKKIIYQYVNGISKENLETQGYDKRKILEDIDNLEANKFSIKDRVDFIYCFLVRRFKLKQFFGKRIKIWAKDNNLS